MNFQAGINDCLICDTPIAVIDLETTGLYPGGDRIVEIAIVRIEPGQKPCLAMNTLVNPKRPVTATEIHGITDADVADAPYFEDLASSVASAMAGCVVAAYNVYFDVKFLQSEWSSIGVFPSPPYLCLMYMRPLLGLGSRCSLSDACRAHGVMHEGAHWAAPDAMASAQLWAIYAEAMSRRGIRCFSDLAKLKNYKFCTSWSHTPLGVCSTSSTVMMKSRSSPVKSFTVEKGLDRQQLVAEYWDALTSALADLQITPSEIEYLQSKQAILQLTGDELRWLHARAFAGLLADVCQDKAVQVAEALLLHHVSNALRQLGWAPGDLASDDKAELEKTVVSSVPLLATGRQMKTKWSLRNWWSSDR